MARTIAEERIPARMPTAVQAALEKANSILQEERTIKLSSASAEAIFALMENPPEPNEYLKNAMRRREETLCRK